MKPYRNTHLLHEVGDNFLLSFGDREAWIDLFPRLLHETEKGDRFFITIYEEILEYLNKLRTYEYQVIIEKTSKPLKCNEMCQTILHNINLASEIFERKEDIFPPNVNLNYLISLLLYASFVGYFEKFYNLYKQLKNCEENIISKCIYDDFETPMFRRLRNSISHYNYYWVEDKLIYFSKAKENDQEYKQNMPNQYIQDSLSLVEAYAILVMSKFISLASVCALGNSVYDRRRLK